MLKFPNTPMSQSEASFRLYPITLDGSLELDYRTTLKLTRPELYKHYTELLELNYFRSVSKAYALDHDILVAVAESATGLVFLDCFRDVRVLLGQAGIHAGSIALPKNRFCSYFSYASLLGIVNETFNAKIFDICIHQTE